MKIIAHFISVLFHPLFVICYGLLILLCVNPFLFSVQDPKDRVLLVLSIFMLSVFFPIFAILMMRFVGLLKSLEMNETKERIGPLVVTGVFYLWLFVNIKRHSVVPEVFCAFVLGATIALFVAFFINNFSKISLHTVGMGGLMMMAIIIQYLFGYDYVFLSLGALGSYQIAFFVILILIIVIGGLVGTSRMILGRHGRSDIWGGYVVGILSQIIAFRIYEIL